jgi:hypothetical protein
LVAERPFFIALNEKAAPQYCGAAFYYVLVLAVRLRSL